MPSESSASRAPIAASITSAMGFLFRQIYNMDIHKISPYPEQNLTFIKSMEIILMFFLNYVNIYFLWIYGSNFCCMFGHNLTY